MLSPQGEAATEGGQPDRLDVPVEALVERLRRRVAALERQLDTRIEEVAELRQQLDDAHALLGESRQGEARAWREVERRAAEHDALMNTFTMRALRRPREWYGAARRRLARP